MFLTWNKNLYREDIVKQVHEIIMGIDFLLINTMVADKIKLSWNMFLGSGLFQLTP